MDYLEEYQQDKLKRLKKEGYLEEYCKEKADLMNREIRDKAKMIDEAQAVSIATEIVLNQHFPM